MEGNNDKFVDDIKDNVKSPDVLVLPNERKYRDINNNIIEIEIRDIHAI